MILPIYIEFCLNIFVLIFNSFYFGSGGLERTDFSSFFFGRVWWSWKNWFLMVSILGGVVVLKELILTVSILGRCGGLERTDF